MPSKTFILGTIFVCAPILLPACGDDHDHEHGGGPAAETSRPAAGGGAAGTGGGAQTAAPGAAAGSAVDPAAAGTVVSGSRGRLRVADGDPENPRVLVVDLDDGAVVARFPTLGTARAYSTEPTSGYAYAVQAVPGLVEIFASGISPAAGGGLTKQAPFPLETRLEGPRPTHWVSHDHWVVSFNDGDGSFDYLLESTLGTRRTLMRRATTGIAHHGVAVIAHGNVVASHAVPDPADATRTVRTGVTVRKLASPDAVVETIPGCPGLHGEAATDRWVAFGCADGILLGERLEGKLAFRKLIHPEGKAIGTLRAREGLPVLVANNRDVEKGYDVGFLLVGPAADSATWMPIDIGVRLLAFLLEPGGTRLVTLGADGQLRLYDPATGAPLGAAFPAIEPYVMGTAPALALGTGVAFVLDPRAGKVTEVDLKGGQPSRVLEVGGQPISAAAFGTSPPPGR
jgi:hypothetical protein